MATVFHVAARLNGAQHAPGTVFALTTVSASTYPGAASAIATRFPNGVSSHGATYLANPPQPHDEPGYVAEAVFEAVRLAEHPEIPSRMESWFASETIEGARAFVAYHRRHLFTDIWRVDAQVVHRGNMGLLNAVSLPVVAPLERASAYWNGQRGPAPEMWEVLVAPGMRLLKLEETTAPTAPPGI